MLQFSKKWNSSHLEDAFIVVIPYYYCVRFFFFFLFYVRFYFGAKANGKTSERNSAHDSNEFDTWDSLFIYKHLQLDTASVCSHKWQSEAYEVFIMGYYVNSSYCPGLTPTWWTRKKLMSFFCCDSLFFFSFTFYSVFALSGCFAHCAASAVAIFRKCFLSFIFHLENVLRT